MTNQESYTLLKRILRREVDGGFRYNHEDDTFTCNVGPTEFHVTYEALRSVGDLMGRMPDHWVPDLIHQ